MSAPSKRWSVAVGLMLVTGCLELPPDHLPQTRPTAERSFQFWAPRGFKRLRLGLVPYRPAADMRESRAGFAAYLAQHLSVPVDLVVGTDFDDVGAKMQRGEIDLAEFSPFAYVRARQRVRLTPLASAISSGSSTAGGYIVVRQDSPRRTLEDLRGARFAFVDRASTSGYLYAMKLFRDRGIDPATYFSEVKFLGSHDAVLLAVLDGGVEAGATWQGALGSMRSAHDINPLSFRVIAKSPRTPQDVICAREDLPEPVRAALKELILRLSVRDKAGRDVLDAMRVNGFIEPDLAAYGEVERIAGQLDAGAP